MFETVITCEYDLVKANRRHIVTYKIIEVARKIDPAGRSCPYI